jgi:hypothetical protein
MPRFPVPVALVALKGVFVGSVRVGEDYQKVCLSRFDVIFKWRISLSDLPGPYRGPGADALRFTL